VASGRFRFTQVVAPQQPNRSGVNLDAKTLQGPLIERPCHQRITTSVTSLAAAR
jgi:hypothetical protein